MINSDKYKLSVNNSYVSFFISDTFLRRIYVHVIYIIYTPTSYLYLNIGTQIHFLNPLNVFKK